MSTAPFQSKLLPHLEFIRECRAKRMSYPQIASGLLAQFGLRAAPSTIFAFIKVRAQCRSLITLPSPARSVATLPTSPSRLRPAQTAASSATPSDWLFYDPAKPLEKTTPTP